MISFLVGGWVWAVRPARQRFGQRRSAYRRGPSMGLRPALPRPAGQVRAVVRFKPGCLVQTQASPTRHIRTMNIKSFIRLSSFAHGFAFICCAARRAINCFRRFRRNRFTNCRPTLPLEPRDIVRVQTPPPPPPPTGDAASRGGGLACMANPTSLFEPRLYHQLNHAAFHENRPILCYYAPDTLNLSGEVIGKLLPDGDRTGSKLRARRMVKDK